MREAEGLKELGVRALFLRLLLLLTLSAPALVLVGVLTGPPTVPPSELLASFASGLTNLLLGEPPGVDDISDRVVWEIRLPRALSTVLAGYLLGLAGLMVQAILRNPLAEPYLLGISSGSALFIVAGIASGLLSSPYMWPLAGFTGGVTAFAAIFLLSTVAGLSPLSIVLAGVAISMFLSSLVTLIIVTHKYEIVHGIFFWLHGSFQFVGWSECAILAPVSAAVAVLALLMAKELNALLLGDEVALNMGFNPKRTRVKAAIVSTFATSVVTALAGPVGFVGLVAPHVSRMILGGDHRLLVPAVMTTSSLVLSLGDAASRTVLAPSELPISVTMAFVGVPYLVYLLLKAGARYEY